MITITNAADLNGLAVFGGQRAVFLIPKGTTLEMPEPYHLILQRPMDVPMRMVDPEGNIVEPSMSLRICVTRDVLMHLLKQMGAVGLMNDPTHPHAKRELERAEAQRAADEAANEGDDDPFSEQGREYADEDWSNDEWEQDEDAAVHFDC